MPAAVPTTPGAGFIHARLLPPARHVLPSLEFVYPLKLIASSPPAAPYLTVFLLSYGGGLVSGDSINVTVLVEAQARLCLLTQGSTKIFKRKHPTHHTTQTLTATLHPSAALLLLPDPAQPFADSHYAQRQTVHLPRAPGGGGGSGDAGREGKGEGDGEGEASVVLLDWVSGSWDLARYESRTEIYAGGGGGTGPRLLLRDALVLDGAAVGADADAEGLGARMDGLGCVATLIVGGPLFGGLGAWVLERYAAEPRVGGRGFATAAVEQAGRWDVLWTATATRGFVLVKVGGREVEEVRGFLGALLAEEGSVAREFGAGALRCLQWQ